MEPALISGFCFCEWESLPLPGWDTNPSQVSSKQTLVLINLPRKDGKLCLRRKKIRSHKYSNHGWAESEAENLWLESRDLTTWKEIKSLNETTHGHWQLMRIERLKQNQTLSDEKQQENSNNKNGICQKWLGLQLHFTINCTLHCRIDRKW